MHANNQHWDYLCELCNTRLPRRLTGGQWEAIVDALFEATDDDEELHEALLATAPDDAYPVTVQLLAAREL